MSQYLNVEEDVLKSNNSYWTAREICQQPRVWREAQAAVDSQRDVIYHWLNPILEKPSLRIILSGAGTSAFIGESLAPWLRQKLTRRIEAVSTTDLVGDPSQYLSENIPTLMISFARSGNSPESVASIELANQVLDECYHLILTCNDEGQLAHDVVSRVKEAIVSQSKKGKKKMFCLLMPEGTNDKSFAMTSSYSSMLVTCAAIFWPDAKQLESAAKLAEQVIDSQIDKIEVLAQKNFERLVILGAGSLLGTAREASLKFLELSAGKVIPMFDTPLGFRHGPKSIVDKTTIIVHFQSSDPYVHKYDTDLINELKRDDQAAEIIELSKRNLSVESSLLDKTALDDLWLSLPYITYCQIFAFHKALALKITADNPCPSGEVNRVVQGVTIHQYNSVN